jgi:geranylgeranyl reductase family protein
VVGAGPAGSTTAALLAEHGFAVALIDRSRFPRSKPCAEYVSPEARRLLDRLLPAGALAAAGAQPLEGMRVVSPGGTSFVGRFRATHGFRGYADRGIAVSRSVLDHQLVRAAQARGATILEDTTLEFLDPPTPSSRLLRLRQGGRRHTVEARLVVGADGIHSRVARSLGVSRRGSLTRVALVTHATGVAGMGSVGEMHVGRRGYIGLAPVGRGLTNVSVVIDPARCDARGKPADRFHHMIQGFPELRARLAHAEYVTPLQGAGPFARWSTRATAERAVLVGDAADFYDPFTGEGIYAAMRGAELLAGHVTTALETDSLSAEQLSPYDRARRHEFRGKWVVERIIAWVVGHPFALDHVARQLRSKPHLADLLVGVTGDFVPAAKVLRPAFARQLLW